MEGNFIQASKRIYMMLLFEHSWQKTKNEIELTSIRCFFFEKSLKTGHVKSDVLGTTAKINRVDEALVQAFGAKYHSVPDGCHTDILTGSYHSQPMVAGGYYP